MTKPKIDYYGICFNDAGMIQFVYQLYKNIVDNFYFYINVGNTDNSIDVIKSLPNCHYQLFSPDILDALVIQKVRNSIWKDSIGKADFVICCEPDEFIWSDDFLNDIIQMWNNGETIALTDGYQMINVEDSVDNGFPTLNDKTIVERYQHGVFDPKFCKRLLWNCNEISDMKMDVGGHFAYPEGNVKYSTKKFYTLHYKYLSYKYLSARHKLFGTRLSQSDLAHGWDCHYLFSENYLLNEFNTLKNNCIVVPCFK